VFQCSSVFGEERGLEKKYKREESQAVQNSSTQKKFAKGDGSPILLEHWNKALLFPLSL
jgi:hypothetical protein